MNLKKILLYSLGIVFIVALVTLSAVILSDVISMPIVGAISGSIEEAHKNSNIEFIKEHLKGILLMFIGIYILCVLMLYYLEIEY